jgi:hypothetical protein
LSIKPDKCLFLTLFPTHTHTFLSFLYIFLFFCFSQSLNLLLFDTHSHTLRSSRQVITLAQHTHLCQSVQSCGNQKSILWSFNDWLSERQSNPKIQVKTKSDGFDEKIFQSFHQIVSFKINPMVQFLKSSYSYSFHRKTWFNSSIKVSAKIIFPHFPFAPLLSYNPLHFNISLLMLFHFLYRSDYILPHFFLPLFQLY